jgi:hypothetical protein
MPGSQALAIIELTNEVISHCPIGNDYSGISQFDEILPNE